MDSNTTETKVVSMSQQTQLTFKPKHYQRRYCAHEHILVDEEHRTLECDTCHQILDPWEFLWNTAVQETGHFTNISYLKKELTKLQEERETLEREIKNLKATLRRHTKL